MSHNIKLIVEHFAPSQDKRLWADEAVNARAHEEDFTSAIHLAYMDESLIYNRVNDYTPDKRWKFNEDLGFEEVTSPNVFKDEERHEIKAKSNAFFSKGSIVIAVNIKFEDCGDIDRGLIINFMRNSAYQIALDKSDLFTVRIIGNDLLFNEKKFYGEELDIEDDRYSLTGVIDCEYQKYKEDFEKVLVNPGLKDITGLTDEVPELTQEYIMEKLIERAEELLGVKAEYVN